jgi:prepilin-type N-terminal cleavage/methylation domain-containing protein
MIKIKSSPFAPFTKKSNIDGFTLIESMAALTILGIVFAYAAPIYLYCRIKIDNNQRTEAALIITERIYSQYATKKISTLPFGGTPITITDPDVLHQQGRDYQVKIEFCPPVISPDEILPFCGASRPGYRTARIAISRNGQSIYSMIVGFADID